VSRRGGSKPGEVKWSSSESGGRACRSLVMSSGQVEGKGIQALRNEGIEALKIDR
jgi:hypothetical protein